MTVLKKRKCKSNTPIVFAVPKTLQDQIKRIPRLSLQSFKDNKAVTTDWYNITFRIKIGLDIAESEYTNVTINPMVDVLEVCISILNRYRELNIWAITRDEVELLENGLDATDEMTDQTTRRVQLDAFHASDKYMKRIVANNNKLVI